MKRFLLAGLCLVGLVGAGSAAAQTVQVRWGSSMYAGPSTSYPVVTFLRSGEGVRLNGCLDDYAWCDITASGNRGWVDADNLAIYRGNTSYTFYEASPWFTYPVTTFLLTDYWRRNYYSQPWYGQWNRYDRYDWRHSNRHWNRPPPPGYRPPGSRPPQYGHPGYPGNRPPVDHRPPNFNGPGTRPPGPRPDVRPPTVDRPGQPNYRPNDRPGQPGFRPNDRPGQPGYRPNDRPGQSDRSPGGPGNRPDMGPRPNPGSRPPQQQQGPRSGGPNHSPRPAQQER